MFRGLVSRRRQRLSFTIICSNDAAAARPKHTAAKISTALTAATCLQADLRREPIIRKLPHCIDRRFSGPERGLTWIRSIRTHANTMSHGSNGSVEGHSEVLALSRKVNNFYLDGFRNASNDYTPFFCGGEQIGLLRPDFKDVLIQRYPRVFTLSAESPAKVTLSEDLKNYEDRSHAVDKVLRDLREKDVDTFVTLKGWREETYDVRGRNFQTLLFKMERAATCLFGLRQYGIDINGYVNHPEKGPCLWMQRRSKTKPTWAGMLDNFVGGGLSTGYRIQETAIKEAQEEANVDENQAREMKPAGTVTYFFESERGLFPNTEFVFDLELPPDFVPGNNDGEVEGFELIPLVEIPRAICSPDMKTTSAPVTLDFLVRRGIINADNEPEYPELVENLHVPIPTIY